MVVLIETLIKIGLVILTIMGTVAATYLLSGLIREKKCAACRVLTEMGVNLEDLQDETIKILKKSSLNYS